MVIRINVVDSARTAGDNYVSLRWFAGVFTYTKE